MKFTKYFFSKNSLTRKILDIEDEIIKIVSPLCYERLYIYKIGGADTVETCLDFWVCVQTDKMAKELVSNHDLNIKLRSVLEKYDYPLEHRVKVVIGFVSIETVNRVSNGSLWDHLV